MKSEEEGFRFETGQVVCHRRYSYRGVIVGGDPSCKAEEEWYRRNQTQPERDQPWYHVLVDGASHTTYVAQENLQVDPSGRRVDHPLVERFFCTFYRGRYFSDSLS